MVSTIVRATWQSGVLSALSNIIGQAITCYQANKPFRLDITDLFHFALFAVLSCPPNFIWQTWLERRFPGRTETNESSERQLNGQPADGQMKRGDASKHAESKKQLSIRNTAIKFALDQTIGAAVKTILFIAGLDLLRGKTTETAFHDCRKQFWPLIFAGQKFWPAVSVLSFVAIPVEFRTTFGSLVGLFWGVYLSLVWSSDQST